MNEQSHLRQFKAVRFDDPVRSSGGGLRNNNAPPAQKYQESWADKAPFEPGP
jgi:hypothetical protein